MSFYRYHYRYHCGCLNSLIKPRLSFSLTGESVKPLWVFTCWKKEEVFKPNHFVPLKKIEEGASSGIQSWATLKKKPIFTSQNESVSNVSTYESKKEL